MILRLLRRAAAGSLGTYTYPVYVGVTVPIGTTIGGVALLLEIVLRKKSQSGIVYKVYTSIWRPLPEGEFFLYYKETSKNRALRALFCFSSPCFLGGRGGGSPGLSPPPLRQVPPSPQPYIKRCYYYTFAHAPSLEYTPPVFGFPRLTSYF